MRRLLQLSCALMLLPATGHAGSCSDSRGETTCTGDFSPGQGQIGIDRNGKAGDGSNGGIGFLGVPAGNGGVGNTGPGYDVTLRNATISGGGVGARLRALGGNGGSGGKGYLGGSPGNGGTGGLGGTVLLQIENTRITTTGQDSVGAIAISLGGVGGSGGDGFITSTAGNGGQGGDAMGAQVYTDAGTTITTSGVGAIGILTQAVGGTGGGGGDAYVISHGGSGAGGANGGQAAGINSGRIMTTGNGADGILSQSIGGFGGNGGGGYGILTFGGDGRTGGNGDYAKALNSTSGYIRTSGANALGMVAQSIGGGGGQGGKSAGIGNLGGSGAAGGNGGDALVLVQGTVTTTGLQSTGVLAQSIGGGGGSGGSASGFISIGGSGGSGGNGGLVNSFLLDATISTGGANADGLQAQSIGGGGGNGGSALSVGPLVSVAVGGSGAAGGNGGRVFLGNPDRDRAGRGTIETTGDGSAGIFLQSVGGGGGSANWTASAAAGPVAGSVAIGGSGGKGGSANSVAANFIGSISTAGNHAAGLFAQSVGGGGGNAGLVLSASAATTGAVAVGLGGSGGDAGNGGTVDVIWRETGDGITTRGISSVGILAQSAGGGGGDAGVTVSGAGAGVGSLGLALGGKGGGGGTSSAVNVDATGRVVTDGADSAGILGESIAGGGGNGGMAIGVGLAAGGSLSLGIGGKGGGAANAGTVSIRAEARVRTGGANSTGVEALSVGGGGGTGGISGALSAAPTVTLGVSLGGAGGTGGNAAAATVNYSGPVTTRGAFSSGVVARSIGGGGGDGGIALGLTAGGVLSGNVTIGGGGATAGNGGAASATVAGIISTDGASANGIEASSIGGSGGSGGFAISGAFTNGPAGLAIGIGGKGAGGGDGGVVTIDSSAAVTTLGAQSIGILGQSIGGGGGSGGFTGALAASSGGNLALTFGGTGGRGGTAGNVTIIRRDSSIISTAGANAQAILAQSVAGGGGRGGMSISGSVGTGIGASIGLGGKGGGGGTAGIVSVTGTDRTNYQTGGAFSDGILAQSVGGGGGAGGLAITGTIVPGSVGAAVSIGGSGGTAGTGNSVAVSLAGGTITTAGDSSAGVRAQSVGGGGGAGGFSGAFTVGDAKAQAAVSVGGSGGSGATAAGVTLTAMGETIQTNGNFSAGLSAQSIGGGGGAGGMAVAGTIPLSTSKSLAVSVGGNGGSAGRSGDVNLLYGGSDDVSQRDFIATTGIKSYGLVAQSIGGGGGAGGMAISARLNLASTAANVAVGGTGGSGNDSGNVTLTATRAKITTQGADAYGVFVQSIGGGGGDGGIAAAGTVNVVPGDPGLGLGVAVGGDGTQGGNAGTVTAETGVGGRTGSIQTSGAGAKGIVAQSIGGGGGDGGSAFTALASLGAVKSVNVAVGGTGGDGGNGAAVDLKNRFDVTTAAAAGILAQSVGGGGGDGGLAASAALAAGEKSLQLNTTVGGNGGKGGNAAAVTMYNVGEINVAGDLSYGILAESIGGGGGEGGSVLSGTLGGTSTLNLGVAVGGKARNGGDAGAVTLISLGRISTSGKAGMGLWALSVGGGGGTGGHAGALTLGGKSSITAGVTVGGNGGEGGKAKAVQVTTQYGSVNTKGENAYAIAAQSVGGGGGFGGLAFTQTYSGGSFTGALSVSVGGSGGKGGTADTVNVSNGDVLTTAGNNAFGIFAQSIGGGGGGAYLSSSAAGALGTADGGSAAFAIGGSGGAGGDGAAVAVNNTAAITTKGDSAHGIYAQSVGGGGGSGGNAKGVAETIAAGSGSKAGYSLSLSASIGGKGGAAGNGSTVNVTNNSAISTAGSEARGIFAQSIGGGGGSGGDLVGLGGELLKLAQFVNAVKSGGDAFPFAVNIGGDGGASGNGAAVTVNNTGRITTTGIGGYAIEAQSIGGGGGDGGNGLTGRINVGGKGGASGNGAAVNVTNNATLSTTGDRASGIFAQSVGGGGGNGGDTNTIAKTDKISISSIGAYLDSISLLAKVTNTDVGISIGGSGGASGNGGTVDVNNSGAISTSGNYANAIFAQSIGGGGGTGGAGIVMKPVQITLPGKGSSAGKGAGVKITNSGALTTTGDAAMGIFAQSIGGGGGVAGSYSVGLFALADVPGWNFVNGGATNYGRAAGGIVKSGDNGDGGNIVINSTGDITVSGTGSIGILAQSAGGGGGLVGGAASEFLGTFGNNGHGGNIDLVQSGTIRAIGYNGVGILLQSAGTVTGGAAPTTNGNITATIGGSVTGGDGLTGSGMVVSGGNDNKITILPTGSLSTISPVGPYQYAFLGGSGNETLTNQGTITGQVDMGGGKNSFLNSGTFYAYGDVKLGSENTIRNLSGGTLMVGSPSVLTSAHIFGSLAQENGGTLAFILHDASTPDEHRLVSSALDVDGFANFYGGTIKFLLDPRGTMPVPGKYSITFLRAGVIYQNDASVQSTNPLVSVSLDKSNRGITAKVSVDYTPDHINLSPTQIAVGNTIASIATHETSLIHPLLHGTLFGQGVADSNFTPLPIDDALNPVELAGSAEQLADVYQSLSPATYAAAETAQLYAAVGFNDTLLADGAAASYRVANDNDRVAWLDLTGRRYSADFAPTTFSENTFGASAGFSTDLGGWKIGAGVGYQQLVDHMSDYSSGSGWRMMAGLTAEHDLGPVEGEVALSAGAENLRTNRRVHGPDGSLYTTVKQTSAFGTATFRVSHAFDFGDWQVRPMIDASVAVLGMPGVAETGAGPLDLDVRGNTSASFRIGPAVDIKGKTTLFGMAVEPRLKVGFSDWATGGNPTVRAAFIGLPSTVPDLVSAQPDSGITADVMAGIGMDTGEGIDMRLFYTGHLNGETQIHAINVQAAYHF